MCPKWGQFDHSTRSSPVNNEACGIHDVQPRVTTVSAGLLLGSDCYQGPSWVAHTLILVCTPFCPDRFSLYIKKYACVPILLNISSYLAIRGCIPSLPVPTVHICTLFFFFDLSLHFWVFLEVSRASPTRGAYSWLSQYPIYVQLMICCIPCFCVSYTARQYLEAKPRLTLVA